MKTATKSVLLPLTSSVIVFYALYLFNETNISMDLFGSGAGGAMTAGLVMLPIVGGMYLLGDMGGLMA